MAGNEISWKTRLEGRIEAELSREIDVFETQLQLRKAGRIDEPVFAETRLRRGVYGQRYDHGRRHDGRQERKIVYPSTGRTTKGPNTEWDAPGMQRIKFPYGGLNAAQMEVLAELAEECSDRIAHITTRQDFQLHFVHIEDTPDLMRRLAAVGVTTREACGNSVRNVTACPLAGICRTECFDVTPYARAFFRFMLGHPDCQDFGRKFKVAFSGCSEEACGLANMHDLGFVAAKGPDGSPGFRAVVGGGLGPTPMQAQVLEEFVPASEILPLGQAVARVFARLGEKKIRSMARIKFLVKKLGIEEFRRLVREERKVLEPDPRWTEWPAQEAAAWKEEPARPAAPLDGGARPEGFEAWRATNVYPQRQKGYAAAYVTVPLGDLTADQLRGLADLARTWVKETVRTTVDQNLLFRWVSERDLPEFYAGLKALGLGKPGANTICDLTACPGTDTCKLGIASSRGLARELQRRLEQQVASLPPEVRALKIKVSGCPNSCGQHHLADIGFFGGSRKVGGYTVPHFNVVLGGRLSGNAASYGLPIGVVPSKRVPQALERLTSKYARERKEGESFQAFVQRVGKAAMLECLRDLQVLPADHDEEPDLFSDWGDPREYTLSDLGKGECAGAVVTPSQFAFEAAAREVFEAQLKLDAGELQAAVDLAHASMHHASLAILRLVQREFPDHPDRVYSEFMRLYCQPDPMSGVLHAQLPPGHKPFARLWRKAKEQPLSSAGGPISRDAVHSRVEEANLWLEAMHSFVGHVTESTPEALA